MQIDGPLDHVLKLPDIAQPVVILQRIPRFRGNPRGASLSSSRAMARPK